MPSLPSSSSSPVRRGAVRAFLLLGLCAVVAWSAAGCRSWREPHDARVRVAAGRDYFVGLYSRKTFTAEMPMPMPMPMVGGGSGGMMTAQLDAWLLGRLRALGPMPDGSQAFSFSIERIRVAVSGPMMGMVLDSAEAAARTGAGGAGSAPTKGDGPGDAEAHDPDDAGRRAGRGRTGGMMGGGMFGGGGGAGSGPMGMLGRMMPGLEEMMSDTRRDLDRALAMLRGFTLTFRVAPDGRIVSVDNPVSLMVRMAESAGSVDREQAAQLRAIAESGVLERVVTWMLGALFPVFDRADARVRDGWQDVRGEPFGLGIVSDRRYEIAKEEGGVLWVSVSGDYRPAPTRRPSDATFPMPGPGGATPAPGGGGLSMSADVAGFEHGGYRIDLATGLLRRATLRQEVTITASMNTGGAGGGRGGGGMGGGMGAAMMSMRMPVRVSGVDQVEVRPMEPGAPDPFGTGGGTAP